MSETVPAPQVHDMARLPPHVYDMLEKQCQPIGVTDGTTELQAGFQLGVQAVLSKLRKGFLLDARP